MPLPLAPAMTAAPALPRLTLPPVVDVRRPPVIAFPEQAASPPALVSRHVSSKHKAVVIMGATGTGKSRLAIDLALRFGGEVINSDKMQVYAGLDVATSKVTADECAGVPHHLLGVAPPDAEFSAADFRREAASAAAASVARGGLPIIAGGSNSYVEELVEGDRRSFCHRYDCCFLWVDVQLPVLHSFVSRRVDDMCRRGLVEEVTAAFDPCRTDYSRGIWRAIGVPELDSYLRSRGEAADEHERERMLAAAIDEIKANTCRLARSQRGKIQRLARLWRVRRVDATEAFLKQGDADDEAWQRLVHAPCIDAVRSFLRDDVKECSTTHTTNISAFPSATAVVAAAAV